MSKNKLRRKERFWLRCPKRLRRSRTSYRLDNFELQVSPRIPIQQPRLKIDHHHPILPTEDCRPPLYVPQTVHLTIDISRDFKRKGLVMRNIIGGAVQWKLFPSLMSRYNVKQILASEFKIRLLSDPHLGSNCFAFILQHV
jgi:hypothetical protein